MRVALDATPLTVATGGVRRYAEELTRALIRTFPEDDYALVSDQPFETELQVRNSTRVPAGWNRHWWLIGVQREMTRLGTEVFHGTDFSVPYLPLRPSVLTLHDISPWRRDLPGSASGRVIRRTPALLRLRIPTMVITPTVAVRNEAVSLFGIPDERMAVVPEAPAALGSFCKPISSRPYFLFAGTIEPRKNVASLIDAWRELRGEADLVLAGRRLTDVGNEPGIRLAGAVPDHELAGLYAGAAACVYPSLYEGFGLPVLEAMAYGSPVITSRDPAITEVAGGAAIQVEAMDVRALREAMRAMLDPSQAAVWRNRGKARAAQFTWERTARETREVYAEAIRRFHQ